MMPEIIEIQPVLMSRNIQKSIEFYDRLGFKLCFSDSGEDPKYVGVRRNNVELHIQWHDPKEWDYPNDRPVYRFVVHDVDYLYGEFLNSGIKEIKAPVKTNWGTYEFHVLDPDLNGLQFYENNK